MVEFSIFLTVVGFLILVGILTYRSTNPICDEVKRLGAEMKYNPYDIDFENNWARKYTIKYKGFKIALNFDIREFYIDEYEINSREASYLLAVVYTIRRKKKHPALKEKLDKLFMKTIDEATKS